MNIDFQAIAMGVVGVGGGVVGASYLNTNLLANLDPKYKPLVPLGIGVVLPYLIPNGGSIINAASAGFIAKGVQEAMLAYAPDVATQVGISGIGTPYYHPDVASHSVGQIAQYAQTLQPDEMLIDPETGEEYTIANDNTLYRIEEEANKQDKLYAQTSKSVD